MEDTTLTFPEVRTSALNQEPDILLSVVAKLVDTGLVLITAGGVITGKVINFKTWADATIPGQDLSSFDPDEREPVTDEEFEKLPDHRKAAEVQDDVVAFLHLRDVVVISGSTRVNVPRLRIRKSEVIGWQIGQVDSAG
ncbi:hypothetical protein CIK75_02525 [Glutamicibacter sp. BW78]|uniref:hypothetical protein n=1 Tax=Glutamicibacter sp. BW78 TaxID=2024403 RepID=UPI000BB98CFF|nr:hypothetical protein [Glutamicibacter sp. BW78]PCC26517.1 hypothetical protein CIK75_02525 [Glutamicibacter sp. BW78]